MTNPATNRFDDALEEFKAIGDYQPSGESSEAIEDALKLAARMERDNLVAVPRTATKKQYEAGKLAIHQCRNEKMKSEAAFCYSAMIATYEKERL